MTTMSTSNFDKLKLNELQAMFAVVVGETTRSPNRTYLIRRITEASGKCDPTPRAERGQTAGADNTQAQTSPETGATDTSCPEPGTLAGQSPPESRLTLLDVTMLQARYLDVVGRPTGSVNRAYLVWKIREAQRGRVPIGPRQGRRSDVSSIHVLPFRLKTELALQLDEVWRRLGLRNRMELLRQALGTYLAQQGEPDLAAQLVSMAGAGGPTAFASPDPAQTIQVDHLGN